MFKYQGVLIDALHFLGELPSELILLCPKMVFFIDTNHLQDTLSWTADWMDLDSKDGCEGNLFFPKLKQSSNAFCSSRFGCGLVSCL